MKHKNQQGISLLEVLFSLAIICTILTIVANYYFSQNKRYMEVSKAATQIHQLANVSYEWQTAQAQADFRGISLNALQAAGLLPKSDSYSQVNPWGGAIRVSAANDSQYVAITLLKVPSDACANLRSRMANSAHTQYCAGGIYYISM